MSKIVKRTLDFFELFAREKRPLSLSDISSLLSIPLSSCHDVLQALLDRGFIHEVAPRAGYYPTLRMYNVVKVIAENDPIFSRAEHLLRGLRDTFDESVLLAKVSGLDGTYLLVFETSHPLRFQVQVGNKINRLHATSAGNAILGSLSDTELDDVLAKLDLTPLTPKTITSKSALRDKIAQGRRAGFYLNMGESIDDLMAITAPFTWMQSLYLVTVVAPTARLESRIEYAALKLLEVCRKLEMKPVR